MIAAAAEHMKDGPAGTGDIAPFLARRIVWEPAGMKDRYLFRTREELRPLADGIYALSHEEACWLIHRGWRGEGEPADLQLVAFAGGGVISALGPVDRWPDNWQRP